MTAHSVTPHRTDAGHDLPLPRALAPTVRPTRRPPRRGELAGDVRATAVTAFPAAAAIETGTLRGGHRGGADRRRQHLLRGELDDDRHPHDLVVRIVHGRAGRARTSGHIRGPQLALLHADPVRAGAGRDSTWQQFDSRTVRTTDADDRRPRSAGRGGGYVSADGRGARACALHGPTANFFSSGDFMRIVYQRP